MGYTEKGGKEREAEEQPTQREQAEGKQKRGMTTKKKNVDTHTTRTKKREARNELFFTHRREKRKRERGDAVRQICIPDDTYTNAYVETDRQACKAHRESCNAITAMLPSPRSGLSRTFHLRENANEKAGRKGETFAQRRKVVNHNAEQTRIDTTTCPHNHTRTYTKSIRKREAQRPTQRRTHARAASKPLLFDFLPPSSLPALAVAATEECGEKQKDSGGARRSLGNKNVFCDSKPFCSPLSKSDGVSDAPVALACGPFGCGTDASQGFVVLPLAERWTAANVKERESVLKCEPSPKCDPANKRRTCKRIKRRRQQKHGAESAGTLQ